ncbi:tetratricopeptide repeat protein [Peribacillus asahii]|uniref:tetratricopeptide repeat protein n=1 Tax=Peribacillus asahii TaxID=228899 RepID=UPI003827FC25
MLTKIIHSYQDVKLAAIKKFSDHTYDILDEPGFLDNGYIRAKIEHLKKEYTRIQNEIELILQYDKKDKYQQQKVSTLVDYRNYLLFHMAFLSSNSFDNLEFAINLIDDIETDFSLCLKALTLYHNGNEGEALLLFEQYFHLHPEPVEHFLINKIFGELLYNEEEFKKAVKFLRKAVEKRPEEEEIHFMLFQTYQRLGNQQQAKVHNDILSLGGGNNVNRSLSE